MTDFQLQAIGAAFFWYVVLRYLPMPHRWQRCEVLYFDFV